MPTSLTLKRIILVLAIALSTGFRQATDTIATVNGQPIPVVVFQQRVRFNRWSSAQQLLQIAQSYGEKTLSDPTSPYNSQFKMLSDLPAFSKQVLDGLIAVRLVQQEASRRGITVTDQDIEDQINGFFGYVPDATPIPGQPAQDPAAAASAFKDHRDNYFGQVGAAAKMSQDDVRAIFAEQALQIKLFEALTGDVPQQPEQTKVRHILVDNEASANALLAQIKGGADFATMALQNSLDSTSAALGGDLGWTPRGTYLAELEQAIWSAAPGSLIGPIKTQFGYHILLIEAREVRPLSEADLARARDAIYQKWLQQARTGAQLQIVDNWQQFIPPDPTLTELGLPELK